MLGRTKKPLLGSEGYFPRLGKTNGDLPLVSVDRKPHRHRGWETLCLLIINEKVWYLPLATVLSAAAAPPPPPEPPPITVRDQVQVSPTKGWYVL